MCADVASMQKDGQEISIDLGLAESYGKLALGKAADRAKAVDFLAYVAEAQCLFQLAKQRYAAHQYSKLVLVPECMKCLTSPSVLKGFSC